MSNKYLTANNIAPRHELTLKDYLTTPSCFLTDAQTAYQTIVFKTLNRDIPESIRPDAVKKPLDRKAIAAKAQATRKAKIRALAAELDAELSNDESTNEAPESEESESDRLLRESLAALDDDVSAAVSDRSESVTA